MLRDEYDVFLAHNSKDKEEVGYIYKALSENGLRPWFDEKEIPPGKTIYKEIEDVMQKCSSIAMLFGANKLGQWQTKELAFAMGICIEEDKSLIPVILPSAGDSFELPPFLKIFRWVKFPTLNDTKALDDLICGITGDRSHFDLFIR